MARMMHLFRKYQYILLVVFGVLLMFVFVVGDALQDLGGGGAPGGRGRGTTVVTWKNGQITDLDIQDFAGQHNVAMDFLAAVVRETTDREGVPRQTEVYQRMRSVANERSLIYIMLLAEKAKSLGLKIDNEAVKQFLVELSDHELTTDNDFAVLFQRAVRKRISQQQLMDQLQAELLAQHMLRMMGGGLQGIPPHEAWSLHDRLRRRVKTEMIALKVDDFVDDVKGEPTEAQIEAMYEEGKERFSSPFSPQFGFRRRTKAAFEYVRADFTKFEQEELEKVKPEITDEEIEKYYEDNKERYRELDLPNSGDDGESTPDDESETPTGEGKPGEKPAEGEEKPTDEAKEGEAKPEEEASSDEKPPAPPSDNEKSEKPAEDPSEKPEAEADKPAEGSTDETEPAPTEKEADAPDAAKEDDCGTEPSSSGAEEAVFQEETPPADSPEPATPETEPVPADSAPEPPAEKTDDLAAPPADEKPAEPETKPEEDPETPEADEEPAEAKDEDESGAEEPKNEEAETKDDEPEEPKYKPLDDELREEIREEIARTRGRQPAQQRMDQAFQAIETEISKYGRKLRMLDVTPDAEKPELVDYESLAGEHGLTAGKTDLVDSLGIEEYELGKASHMDFSSMTTWPPPRYSFAQLAYQEGLPKYRPQRIRGEEFNIEFMYWKVDEAEGYVPELEEVRDEIVAAWKNQEALLLAKSAAEKLVKEAGKKKLTEVFGERDDVTIIEPSEFSWMTTGATPFGGAGAPTLSSVEGVEFGGQEFMRSVFALGEGETGIATNQPEDHVYVVRIDSESPSEAARKQLFLLSGLTDELRRIAVTDQIDFLQDLERELQVAWHN